MNLGIFGVVRRNWLHRVVPENLNRCRIKKVYFSVLVPTSDNSAMKYLFFCLFLFLGELTVTAQHIFFRQFPFLDQLSSNEIQDIHQDREGFFWIATTNGLARYDGYRLLNFRSNYKNQNLLAANAITSIDDNNLYVWIANWGGLNLYDKQTCRIMPFPDKRFQNHSVSYVAVDKTENVWVASDGRMYKCDSIAHIVKEYELVNSAGKSQGGIQSIYIDRKNQVWVMATNGIFKHNSITDTFIHYPCSQIGTTANVMYQDQSGSYWLGTWGAGLWHFSPDKEGEECCEQYKMIEPNENLTESTIYSIEQDDTFGYLWVLSYAGLYVLKHKDNGTLEMIDIHNLIDTHMMYTRICKDKEGNLWLGSYDTGYTILFNNPNVDNFPLLQLKKKLGWDANILNLSLDNDSIMWFEQDRHGLCLYNLSHDLFVDSNIGEVNIIKKSLHKSGVWVNSKYEPHVMRLSQKDMKVQVEEDIFVAEGGVGDLIEDKEGNLWISVWYGSLNVKCPDRKLLVASNEKTPRIASLASDMEGNIWGISYDRQIYRLTCIDHCISCELKGRIPILSEKEEVEKFCFDKEGCLWLNTSLERILRSDKTMKTFENISVDNMMDNCTVLGLLSEKNNVWIITNKEILQYNIESQTYLNHSTADDNVVVETFRYRAVSSDGQGGLYVGGHKGFIHIRDTKDLSVNEVNPHLYITDVKVEDKSIFFDNISKENTINRITLIPTARNIEIFFSPLLYSVNTKYRIAYRLEGMDNDWNWLEHGKYSVFYNRLPKGTYKLHLKLESEWGRKIEDEVTLTITKEPAYYETWFAYFLYVILIGLCIYLVIFLYIRRMKLKSGIKLEEELTRMKLTYFTNISHELLTPLTVISCITDYFEQKNPAARQQSIMLKANVDKLKRLIQQVLDFRKMDMGKLKLNVSEGNIREFIMNICKVNFMPLAQKKNITLEVDMDVEELYGYADFDKLDKILHNLLSNAIKYTPENKYIRVKVEVINEYVHRVLVIKVEDKGIGISSNEIEHIFTRFYNNKKNRQVESNGIGLSLTKDLVNMHHGDIAVESVLGQGSCFTVKLPIDKGSYTSDELFDETMVIRGDMAQIAEDDNVSFSDTDQFSILLIDDNVELLSVMKEMFKERYKVLTATDGRTAYDKLNNNEVNVIICDVMLPDINGWELCTRIKGDLRFNHIPVIILTARNGADDRIASYEAGADGYIAKPFELRILLARIDNLVRASKMRQITFRKEENPNLESLAYPLANKKFLQSIIDSIDRHLDETEYSLDQLSVEVHMSKSTLYRKIKSMTGMTPLDFVRNIKMKRACMMLLDRTQNISEIAYAIGFTSPRYFSKCFKDEFGVSPTEYVQKHNDIRGSQEGS